MEKLCVYIRKLMENRGKLPGNRLQEIYRNNHISTVTTAVMKQPFFFPGDDRSQQDKAPHKGYASYVVFKWMLWVKIIVVARLLSATFAHLTPLEIISRLLAV